jgi:QWRF family
MCDTTFLYIQITYLEEWSLIDKDHSHSLSDATEALKASTLRLPVVGGAKVLFLPFVENLYFNILYQSGLI